MYSPVVGGKMLMNVCATGLQGVCRLCYFDSTDTLIQQQLLNDYVQPETASFGLGEPYVVCKHAITVFTRIVPAR